VERFDLTFSRDSLQLPAAKAVLDLLNRGSFKRKLETLAGYDTAHTGNVVM
jgi:molybdate-binding protein